jgi:hypothetical protein
MSATDIQVTALESATNELEGQHREKLQALAMAMQVGQGLAEGHSKHVPHRRGRSLRVSSCCDRKRAMLR